MGRKKKEDTGGQATPATEAGEVEVVQQYYHYYFDPKGHIVWVSEEESSKDLADAPWCIDCVAHQPYASLTHIVAIDAEQANEKYEALKVDPLAPEGALPTGNPVHGLGKGETVTVPVVNHPGYAPGGSEIIQYIGIDQLRESSSNPRRHYDEKALNDLAESIKAKGVVQNLVVCALPDSTTRNGAPEYVIVAGSRRYRAAKIAELKALPCVVRSYSDAEVLEIQVIENNQREDVHPLEEGEGYAALLKVEGYTVEAIAGKIGRSDKYVRERLQLAKLVPEAKKLLEEGAIYYTHSRLLARLTEDQQKSALMNIWAQGSNYDKSRRVPVSVATLEGWIERNVEKALGSASFPLDDKTINKQAGACVSCQFNTSTDMQLFPDYASSNKKGVCLKPECFNQKVKSYADRQVKEKLKADAEGKMLLVSGRQYHNIIKVMADGTERVVVGWDNFAKVKKGEKGAVEALMIGAMDTCDKGKTVWVKLKNKKDAKPAKGEAKQSRSQYPSEPELTPEQKAEKERKEKNKRTAGYELVKVIADKIRLAQTTKKDEKLLRRAYINAMIRFEWRLVSQLAGMTLEESDAASLDKIHNLLIKKVENLKLKDIEALFIAASLMNDIETEKDIVDLCKLTRVNLKECAEESNKIADELYPDPAKQLIVNFTGLKYGLKESDYVKELEYISNELKKLNKKEGTDYKEVNLINPGGNNVCFRKDAKSGVYRFSTWIDSDGTAMGFDKLPEAKFKKMVKGFAAVKAKSKSKKAKKKK